MRDTVALALAAIAAELHATRALLTRTMVPRSRCQHGGLPACDACRQAGTYTQHERGCDCLACAEQAEAEDGETPELVALRRLQAELLRAAGVLDPADDELDDDTCSSCGGSGSIRPGRPLDDTGMT